MTYEDKGSYACSPPCRGVQRTCNEVKWIWGVLEILHKSKGAKWVSKVVKQIFGDFEILPRVGKGGRMSLAQGAYSYEWHDSCVREVLGRVGYSYEWHDALWVMSLWVMSLIWGVCTMSHGTPLGRIWWVVSLACAVFIWVTWLIMSHVTVSHVTDLGCMHYKSWYSFGSYLWWFVPLVCAVFIWATWLIVNHVTMGWLRLVGSIQL